MNDQKTKGPESLEETDPLSFNRAGRVIKMNSKMNKPAAAVQSDQTGSMYEAKKNLPNTLVS